MSFMSRKEFEGRFFPFWTNISYMMEIGKRMIEVEILRYPSMKKIMKNRGVLVTPLKTYVSKDLNLFLLKNENIMESLGDINKPFFQKENLNRSMFSPRDREDELMKMTWVSNHLTTDQSFIYDTDPFMYFKLLNRTEKMESRFYPSSSEYSVYMKMIDYFGYILFPNGKMDMTNMMDMITRTNKVYDSVRTFHYNNYLMSRIRRDDKEFMSLIETRTYYDSLITDTLNSKNLRTWIKTRHNMFGVSILMEMSLDIPPSFDVDLVSTFDFMGDGAQLTPDYYIEKDNKLFLIDFAVTVGNMLKVVDRKMKNYEPLANELSKHLKKEVKVLVMVWNIKEKDSFYLPSEFEFIRENLSKNKMLDEIYKKHLIVSSMENYDTFSHNMDLDLDSELYYDNLEDKNNSYLALMESLLSLFSISGKKTYDVSDTRKETKNKDMKKFKDMDIYKDLVDTKMLNEESYYEDLKNDLKMMLMERSYPKMFDDLFTVDTELLLSKSQKIFKEQEDIRTKYTSSFKKVNKVFKFPFHSVLNNLDEDMYIPLALSYESMLDDGTVYINDKEKIPDKKFDEYNEEGIGMDMDYDTMIFDELYKFLKDKNMAPTDKEVNYCKQIKDKMFYKELVESNLWSLVYFVSDLMENICYMEGRRFLKKEKGGHTVAKSFGSYILMVKKGSKLTAEKQIRYKLMTHKNNNQMSDSMVFHDWQMKDDDYMETKWLTVSITDMKHFVKAREVVMSMASDYYDKRLEMMKSSNMVTSIMDRSFIMSVVCMLEHKRGTSTSLQLNRYLLHSSSSFATNREKLMDDIFSSPSRSRLESYVKMCQMNWYMHMMSKYDSINYERVENMFSTDTSHDRVYFPSFFDLNLQMEFSMMMNEIYLCNLFEKEAGFQDHRMKQIVSKMTDAEMKFQKNKMKLESQGEIRNRKEFLKMPDELHMFDKNFIVAATKKYFKIPLNKAIMMDGMIQAMTEVIDSAMMMTSSLVSANYKSEVLKLKNKVEKTKCFLSLYEILEEMPTHMLIGMVSMTDVVEAIFTIFPKSQVGGPREILIQSVMLRVMVKFLETISIKMCAKHKKEMITKDRLKAELQSSEMSKHKEMMMMLKKKGRSSLMMSFNSDASKWAPGFVMEHFMHFVFNWETDEAIKDFMCTVISSFSNKVIITPDRLMEKWMKKPDSEKEFVDSIQKYRDMCMENEGVVILESGMGQGMFHKLSSLYYVIMDDMMDEMIDDILMDLYKTSIHQTTMISSDDKTKMALMSFEKPEHSDRSILAYLFIIDSCSRLCNIHTNWKKSGLQFVITEFNSLFSIGKRMCWATVKDLYTALSVPDLTSPEEAVKFMLSSIRRCFEHGVFLNTIEVMLMLARNQLMRYYKISKFVMNSLCSELNCDESNLPFQMGFVPTTRMVETLLLGPELHMFKEENSKELMMFYKGLYTAGNNTVTTRSRHYIPFDETGAGKYWIELPTRLDKRLIEMKDSFYENMLKTSQEEIIKKMNRDSVNVNLKMQDRIHHNMFKESFFVGMNRKYEFQETMVVHSLIRALQLSNSKAMIYPKEVSVVEMEDILHNKKIHNDIKKKVWQDVMNSGVDLLEFCKTMIKNSVKKSSLFLLDGYRQMEEISKRVQLELQNMIKSKRNSHPKMRELRFNMSEMKSNFDKKDMVNFIFDRSSDFKNSTLRSFNKICTLFGVEDNALWKNPFKFMREKIHDKEYCYKTFMEFIEFNSKMSGNIKVRMLCDFPDSGNMKINLLNLYRSRMSPLYIMDYQSNKHLLEEDVEFLSKMAFSMDPSERLNKELKVGIEDSKVTRARKLCSYGVNTDVRFKFISNDRLYYSRQNKNNKSTFVWTDLSFLAVATEEMRNNIKKINMRIWSQDKISMEENPNTSAVRRYLLDNVSSEILFLTNNYITSDDMMMYNINDKQLVYRVTVSNYMSKYKLNLNVSKLSNSFYSKNNEWYKFTILEDMYTFSSKYMDKYKFGIDGLYTGTLKEMAESPPDIVTLDKILVDHKWIRSVLFEKDEEITEDDYRRSEISYINKQFSAEGVMDILPKLINLNFNSREQSDMSEYGNINLFDLRSKLQLSMMNAEIESEESASDTEFPLYETSSVSKVVEKIISSAANSYLRMNLSLARTLLKMCKGNMERFHNMVIWLLKEEYPEVSDSMILMLYNIKLKEISFNTYINPTNNIKIIDPSDNTKLWFKNNIIFSKVSEETSLEMMSMIEEFS